MNNKSLNRHIESRMAMRKKEIVDKILKKTTKGKKKRIQTRLMKDVRKVENDENHIE